MSNSTARTGVSVWPITPSLDFAAGRGSEERPGTMSSSKQQRERQTSSDARWRSVLSRDGNQDGKFFYGVQTTGVFCRPSCGARTPRPENVTFFDTVSLAERAGYRACRRCKPTEKAPHEQQAQLIAELCKLIEQSTEMPTLKALAERAQLSVYHLHRVFKAMTGLTPRQYAREHRAERLRSELQEASSVTAAIFDAGYNTSSRFYEQSIRQLGMNPSRYRMGGKNAQIQFAVAQCSLGAILIAATDRGVCAILMGDDPEPLARELQNRFPNATLVAGDAEFEITVATVVSFVEAPGVGLQLPLDVRGTAFQQRVWAALRTIPAGVTLSYTELARRLGAPKSARAVASACAANAIAVAIPCHRIVRGDGGLSGYRWGIDRKAELLRREARP